MEWVKKYISPQKLPRGMPMENIVIRVNPPLGARRMIAISNKLQEKGLDTTFVTLSKETDQLLTKNLQKSIYLIDELEEYDIKGNPTDHLSKFEEKYNIPSSEWILAGDLEHSKMGRKKAYTLMAKHFYFWEDLFQKNEFDFMFGGTERIFNMIPRIVAKRYGVQDATLGKPISGRRVCVTTDAYGHFSLLDEYWEKNKGRDLTEEERQRATQFINSFREKKDQEFVRESVPKFNIRSIRFFLDRLRVRLFLEKGRYPYTDMLGGTYRYMLRWIRARLVKKYYSKFDPREKYVFYPIQGSHEANIRARAPQYVDQTNVIRNIAKSLPARYQLYVKGHPGLKGMVPLEDLNNITKLPNVKLIPHRLNALKVIEDCACVVVVNSTVGWDAMLLGKPVINLGRAFYETSGLTYPLRDFYKMPETIQKAINENPVKEDVLTKFVNAIFATSFPGDLRGGTLGHLYYGWETQIDKVLKNENIENLAEGIYNQLEDILEES